MKTTVKKQKFVNGDLVRHRDTKKIGIVQEIFTYQEMKDKGHNYIWPDTYYTIFWGNENVNQNLQFHFDITNTDTTCIGERKLSKPRK